MPDVLIVGAGISGLSAAFFLKQRRLQPLVLEASDRVGGLVKTRHIDGCDLEAGPDSFIATKPALRELAAELGVQNAIIPSNDAQRRVFLAHRGALAPMPAGMVMMAPSQLGAALRSPLFSLRTKLRFARELFTRPRTRAEDVTMAEFVADHFGAEMLEIVAEPLLTGVYGGHPAELSVRSVLPRFLEYEEKTGSLIRAVQQEQKQRKYSGSLFLSFAGGMQTLIDALARAVGPEPVRLQEPVSTLARSETGWRVRTSKGEYSAPVVLLAVPAHRAAEMLAASSRELSAELQGIPYSSAILVTFVFDAAGFGHPLNGFGFLAPSGERQTIAAATWVNTKFPSRVGRGRVVVRTFIVGDEAVSLAACSDGDIGIKALHDVQHWMKTNAQPTRTVVDRWPESMPQYVRGHEARLKRINALAIQQPGLSLAGNAYAGVGLPDCVRLAREVADQLAAQIS